MKKINMSIENNNFLKKLIKVEIVLIYIIRKKLNSKTKML